MKSLMVFCSNLCGWKGKLGALGEHVSKDCENAQVTCPNDCSSSRFERKNLRAHLSMCPRRKVPCQLCGRKTEHRQLAHHHRNKCPKREYSCPNCAESGCYDERTTTHLTVCPMVEIQCPKCSCTIVRCEGTTHPQTCINERVPCKYYDIGCTEKPLRKNLQEHEKDTQFHLTKAIETVLELKKTELKKMVTFKMTNFENARVLGKVFYSPPIFTSRKGYKLCVIIDANGQGAGEGTHVSVFAFLLKGDNDDSLTWPFTGTVTFELLSQLEDKNHHKIMITFLADNKSSKRVVDGERGEGWGCPQFISHTKLGYQPDKNCQYLKDDTLVFRASSEAPDYKPWLECTP